MRRLSRKRFVVTTLLLCVVVAVALALAKGKPGGAARWGVADETGAMPESVAALVRANNEFACKAYKELARQPGNIFFSPYSLHTALGMAYEGARGDTAARLEALCGFEPDAALRRPAVGALHNSLRPRSAAYELSIANAMWVQQDQALLPDFTSALSRYYSASVQSADFRAALAQAAQAINAWAEQATDKRITQPVPSAAPASDVSLLLSNAAYFSGLWLNRFERDGTTTAPFNAPGGAVDVAMMHCEGHDTRFGYRVDEHVEALTAPYKGEELSMLILLPLQGDAGGTQGEPGKAPADSPLERLEALIDADYIASLRPEFCENPIECYLPRFTLDSNLSFADALVKLGAADAFGGAADCGGMDGSAGPQDERGLYLADVLQQARLEVDEEGTRAAVTTFVIGCPKSGAPEVFRADHPFIFLIQDNATGLILFMGRLENPQA
jgi:serpin B